MSNNMINKTSEYKGVHWNTNSRKWCARIIISGNSKSLGQYKFERDAAIAYDKEAAKLGRETNILKFKNANKQIA